MSAGAPPVWRPLSALILDTASPSKIPSVRPVDEEMCNQGCFSRPWPACDSLCHQRKEVMPFRDIYSKKKNS